MDYDPQNILEKIYFTEGQGVMQILVRNAAHFLFLKVKSCSTNGVSSVNTELASC